VAWEAAGHAGRTCEEAAEAVRSEAEAKAVEAGEEGATFKRCPACGSGITHYRAHGCHHITHQCKPGAPPAHWCYVCMGKYPCKAGCALWCDDTCDCADCPDCRRGRPCGHCVRVGCPSCKGEGKKAKATRLARQTAARAAKVAGGWTGPSRSRPSNIKPTDYYQQAAPAAPAAAAVHPGFRLPNVGVAAAVPLFHNLAAQMLAVFRR